MSEFTLAHVSDLHVSPFGDTLHDRARLVRRSAQVMELGADAYQVCWQEDGWRVLRERQKKRPALMLLDPGGYAHRIPSSRAAGGLLDPVERAAAKACRLEARSAHTLARRAPTEGALASMLEDTPHNSNLRCLRGARAVAEHGVDAVVITGDCTDDGDGWELIETAFARWRERGRLFVIPGNHDLYRFPVASSARPRPTQEVKRERWRDFASRAGIELEPCGAWRRIIPEADAVIIGLDSCSRPQRTFYRQNGAIGPGQLSYLLEAAKQKGWRNARHRIVLFHHHLVPLPHGVGRRAPTEFGMRLDDAPAVIQALAEAKATLVMHGHRHISERRHPAGCDFELLAAPSLTLGCKSGDAPSFWAVGLGKHRHAERIRVPVPAIEQQNDPGTERPPPLNDP